MVYLKPYLKNIGNLEITLCEKTTTWFFLSLGCTLQEERNLALSFSMDIALMPWPQAEHIYGGGGGPNFSCILQIPTAE